ncbi:hypothetical protein [Microbacterium sp.]|uniref:hypothetical protein n=1 Tax=Microbacterium sp. TaxID=51671 RepID=UPI002736EB65|nr:hypothetical protein [Microbacterium sp.]MDP3950309.1 hypothetical protein [Microbacterium sp.]
MEAIATKPKQPNNIAAVTSKPRAQRRAPGRVPATAIRQGIAMAIAQMVVLD